MNDQQGETTLDRGKGYEQCFLWRGVRSRKCRDETMMRSQKAMVVSSFVDECAAGCQLHGWSRFANAERGDLENDLPERWDGLRCAVDVRRRRRMTTSRRVVVGGEKKWGKKVAKRS